MNCPMNLSIITVTWNNEKQLERQLKSVVSGCKNLEFEQIVVDNASADKTVEIVKTMSNVKVIVNTENKGFSHANNQGVEISSGEYLLFLNPDMKVEEGSLDVIVDWLEKRKDVGIVSPRLVDENGKLNEDAKPRRLPRVWEQVALILKLPHIFPKMMDKYLMKDFDGDKEQEVDSVRGSFMLMRREVVEKLGFAFDPRYYIWYEDVDICREVTKMGLKVMYSPVITAVDYVGQSFKAQESMWKQKNFTRSMLTYFQKWEAWYKWMWIWLARPIGILLVYLKNKNCLFIIDFFVILITIVFVFRYNNLFFWTIDGLAVLGSIIFFLVSIHTFSKKRKILSVVLIFASLISLLVSLWSGYQSRDTKFQIIDLKISKENEYYVYKYKLKSDGVRTIPKFEIAFCPDLPIDYVGINNEQDIRYSEELICLNGNYGGKRFVNFEPRDVEIIVRTKNIIDGYYISPMK